MTDTIRDNEQQHLDLVLKELDKKIVETGTRISRAKDNLKEAEKGWQDIRVKFSDFNAVVETGASVHAQQQILAQRERDQSQAEVQMATLKKLQGRPYFARIDFIDQGDQAAQKETIYIGLASFADESGHFYVYDWRAPISSIYYDGALGKIDYQTPDGTQTADVKLKRQFEIADGVILTLFDTEEAVGDKLLLEALSSDSSTKMKSIVTTIQREQNRIIRDTDSDLLFVQGAAGSGKTAAVLQRIAYLLYRYRGKITSGQVVLFSPNQIFNDYVNEVLPDLGENNMIQMTFYQYANYRLPKIEVQTLAERFESENDPESVKMTDFKGSLPFFKAVRQYSQHIGRSGMSFRNLMFQGEIFFSSEEIAEIYYSFNGNYSLSQRLEATKQALLRKTMGRISSEMKKRWVDIAIENLAASDLELMLGDPDKREFESEKKERNELAKKIVREALKPVFRRIRRGIFMNPNKLFLGFLKAVPTLLSLDQFGIQLDEWSRACDRSAADLADSKLNLNDTAIYLYLFDLVNGHHGDRSIRFLFVDEVQDYTAFQLAFLKFSFPKAKFTLLGDLNQAIFTRTNASSLESAMYQLFDPDKSRTIKLTKTYRSTEQITDFTSALLTDSENIEAFAREGQKPQFIKGNAAANLVKILKDNLADELTTAIITKTAAQAKEVHEDLLQAGAASTLITLENQRLVPGTIVIPGYLAKGLEFDAVILWQVDNRNYSGENDRELLYTVASRAMHRLTILSDQEFSRLFNQVDEHLYEKI
ncbi:MAG: RNA polymerase recycling motor HelD [Oenococcus sp.]|uniref:RNA polymerase recycling motor HelD n=1 Tax=Oenococcus TaxID=46254 RepID=UPI0021E78673|nr:RNA polymerase recycling motor HelD [Oenococcus kitaharae]MCV3296644.1 AAA family ATPase [Oenococcus kitaharae]